MKSRKGKTNSKEYPP